MIKSLHQKMLNTISAVILLFNSIHLTVYHLCTKTHTCYIDSSPKGKSKSPVWRKLAISTMNNA